MIYIKRNLKRVEKINNCLYFELNINETVIVKKFMNTQLLEV